MNVNNLCCRRYDNLLNILKLQAVFLYSIYHHRTGKTSLFHMRGVDFTHFNTGCTFKHFLFPTCNISHFVVSPELTGWKWCHNYMSPFQTSEGDSFFPWARPCQGVFEWVCWELRKPRPEWLLDMKHKQSRLERPGQGPTRQSVIITR